MIVESLSILNYWTTNIYRSAMSCMQKRQAVYHIQQGRFSKENGF